MHTSGVVNVDNVNVVDNTIHISISDPANLEMTEEEKMMHVLGVTMI